jgi:hypothetical protein
VSPVGWHGRILNGTIHDFGSHSFKHTEESAKRSATTDIEFGATVVIEGTIDDFMRIDDPLAANQCAHATPFRFEIRCAPFSAGV